MQASETASRRVCPTCGADLDRVPTEECWDPMGCLRERVIDQIALDEEIDAESPFTRKRLMFTRRKPRRMSRKDRFIEMMKET
jgi:hypothetical protein